MRKINSSGFVLAETLVVAVFLMAIFTLIFTNFYPLIGEYEKRETYDDVDGKYAVYWLKRMIEDSSYELTSDSELATFFKQNGYIRFECKNVKKENEKQQLCINIVKALEVKGCDINGNHCEIYITKYQLNGGSGTWFKQTIENKNLNKKRFQVNCTSSCNKTEYINECEKSISNATPAEIQKICETDANRNEFRSGFKEYIKSLPDYKVESLDDSGYRVIAAFQHKKNNNNYYSYSTIEVDR